MSMQLDSTIPLPAAESRTHTILCCNCGAPIDGTTSIDALCHDCIKLNVDISSGIQREAVLHTCRDCDRWLSPPNHWLVAALESRELLALCLRKLRGLSRARIIDASFIWTEPHSRRIRVKITVQAEQSAGTILQQTFEVEYVIQYYQCPDCAKSYTHNTWRANVQVRQKVPHKRTFLYLEQLILKHGAHKDAINIKEVDSGIDFYFAQRNNAEKFVDFLSSMVPVRSKKSQQLISMDVHTSSKSYKFSFSVEIVPICKDDLVALPLKLASQIGNIAPVTLCTKIGTALQLMDPTTLQTAELSTPIYWRSPFSSLTDVRELTEFIIMDIEPLGFVKGRHVLAEATVRRAADFGVNDTEFVVRTHLGGLLHPGDTALGYYLSGAVFNSPELEKIESSKYGRNIPEVVLVKKLFPRKSKKKNRNWKLKRMAREEADEGRKGGKEKGVDDYEMFLRDVEEDEELRETVDLWRAQPKTQKKAMDKMSGVEASDALQPGEDDVDFETDDGNDDGLEIPMDQLRDEFEAMDVSDGEY